MSKIQGNLNSTRWEAERNVRNNLVKSVEEAKLKVEQITKEEIAKAPNYNYKEKIEFSLMVYRNDIDLMKKIKE